MQSQIATLAQIAAKAGVSKNTVSLALRNAPKISAATRRRIATLAKEMGYQPNPRINEAMRYVRSHRARRRMDTLGVLLGWPVRRKSELPYNQHNDLVFSSIEKRAAELGYSVDYIPMFEEGMTATRLKQILDHRGIRGLIVAPTAFLRGRLRLDLSGYACVQIGHTLWAPRIHTVATNEVDGVTLAAKMLWRKGYRRIGFYFPRWSVAQSWNRLQIGVLNSQALLFRNRRPIPIGINENQTRVEDVINLDRLRSDFIPWFRKHRPEAIVGMAVTIKQVLERDLGVAVPEEVGLVQFDFVPRPDIDLAGIDYQKHIMAATAVDHVSAQLYHNHLGLPEQPVEIVIGCKWRDGPTLKRHRDS